MAKWIHIWFVVLHLQMMMVQADNAMNIYCFPVFNCRPGHFVKRCSSNYTQDTCMPCPPGQVQPNIASSTDKLDQNLCFIPDEPTECPETDTVHSREPYNTIWCRKRCQCNVRDCYYGVPCLCNRLETACGIDQELNVATGKCMPCPAGKNKTENGCEPCEIDVHSPTLSKEPYLLKFTGTIQTTNAPTKKSNPKTTSTTSTVFSLSSSEYDLKNPTTKQSGQSEAESFCTINLVLLGTLIVAVIVAGVSIIMCCRYYRRIRRYDGEGNRNEMQPINET